MFLQSFHWPRNIPLMSTQLHNVIQAIFLVTTKCSIKAKNFICVNVVSRVLGLVFASGRHVVTLTQGSIYTILKHCCIIHTFIAPTLIRFALLVLEISLATREPWFERSCDTRTVFPPGAAHMSSTALFVSTVLIQL